VGGWEGREGEEKREESSSSSHSRTQLEHDLLVFCQYFDLISLAHTTLSFSVSLAIPPPLLPTSPLPHGPPEFSRYTSDVLEDLRARAAGSCEKQEVGARGGVQGGVRRLSETPPKDWGLGLALASPMSGRAGASPNGHGRRQAKEGGEGGVGEQVGAGGLGVSPSTTVRCMMCARSFCFARGFRLGSWV
jgi:hypothetical protein